MTALADLISRRDRERLAARLADLRATERLLAERGQQQPPPPPVPLHQTAAPKE
ncbi:MAG TPA: hypothetical protein VGF32_31010 [Streptosporangiaceae bacterium]|jgi:hypothetical protein